jgi:hypothetical protein
MLVGLLLSYPQPAQLPYSGNTARVTLAESAAPRNYITKDADRGQIAQKLRIFAKTETADRAAAIRYVRDHHLC